MVTHDPKIMTIEIFRSGKVQIVFEVDKGQTQSYLEDELEPYTRSLPAEIDKNLFDFFKMIGVCAYSGSNIKVYLNVGDRVYCFLIDSNTGQLIDTC